MLDERPWPRLPGPGQHMRIIRPVNFQVARGPAITLVIASGLDDAGGIENFPIGGLIPDRPDTAAEFRQQNDAQIFILQRQRLVFDGDRLATERIAIEHGVWIKAAILSGFKEWSYGFRTFKGIRWNNQHAA